MPYILATKDAILNYAVVPIWWYSVGLLNQIKRLSRSILELDYLTGFSIWLTHIFIPMYGQHDWQGRLISIFIRITQIIIRGILLLVLVVIRTLITVIYIIAPLIVIWELYRIF